MATSRRNHVDADAAGLKRNKTSAQSVGPKLYVPSQCQCTPSVGPDTLTRALNPANRPVPSENVHSPRPVVNSRVQRPNTLFPSPASSTTFVSNKPVGIP